MAQLCSEVNPLYRLPQVMWVFVSPRLVLQLCRTLAAMAGKTCNGSVVRTAYYAVVPAAASGAGLQAIHWNFTHGLCVVQFSKTLHVLQTAEYMTWKTPTHVYEACNQHNSSCCKMETPGNFALTLPWLESKYLRDRTDQNYESTDVLSRTGRRARPPLI